MTASLSVLLFSSSIMPMSLEASFPVFGLFLEAGATVVSDSAVSAKVADITTLSLLETFPKTLRWVLLSKDPYAFLVGLEPTF